MKIITDKILWKIFILMNVMCFIIGTLVIVFASITNNEEGLIGGIALIGMGFLMLFIYT